MNVLIPANAGWKPRENVGIVRSCMESAASSPRSIPRSIASRCRSSVIRASTSKFFVPANVSSSSRSGIVTLAPPMHEPCSRPTRWRGWADGQPQACGSLYLSLASMEGGLHAGTRQWFHEHVTLVGTAGNDRRAALVSRVRSVGRMQVW